MFKLLNFQTDGKTAGQPSPKEDRYHAEKIMIGSLLRMTDENGDVRTALILLGVPEKNLAPRSCSV